MNRGVELLIARMKSNPEEFKPDNYTVGGISASRWEGLLYNWKHCLTEEEVHAFREALKETHRELFSQEVMKHILRRGDEGVVAETMSVTGLSQQAYQHPYNPVTWSNDGNITISNGATTTGTINIGQQSLDEDTIAHLKAHLRELKMAGKL